MGAFLLVLLDNNNNSTRLETLLCLIHPSNIQFLYELYMFHSMTQIVIQKQRNKTKSVTER